MFINFNSYYKNRLPDDCILLEIGANKGQWQSEIIKEYSSSKIFAFEPIPNITPALNNVTVVNKAIDLIDGEIRDFYVTKDNVTSSLLKLNLDTLEKFVDFKDSKGVEHKVADFSIDDTIKVETIRLDTFIAQNKLDQIHFVKIDTEGNDYNVLLSMEKELDKIWGFEVETFINKDWLFHGSKCTQDFIDFATERNFILVERFIHGRGNTHDLLFVNKRVLKS